MKTSLASKELFDFLCEFCDQLPAMPFSLQSMEAFVGASTRLPATLG